MYTGTNVTALKSMKWLADALESAILTSPYQKITIRDICSFADVSRQTFYNLFESKDEVLHYCLRRKYEEMFDGLASESLLEMSSIINMYITFYADNRGLIDCMINNHLEGVITEELSNSISTYLRRFVKHSGDDERVPYATAMLAGALSQLEVYLMKRGETIEYERFYALLSDFFDGELYSMK